MPETLPAAQDAERRLRRIRLLAHLLDDAVGIPFTRWQFGIDSVLGLIPGAGDALGAVLAGSIVFDAARLGTPPVTLARMLGNIVIDSIIGSVPLAGDLLDVAWKANRRNVRLLERHIDAPERARRASWRLIIGIGAAIVATGVLATVAGIWLAIWLVQLISH
ncbi:MAG TPA: DUF4112 domain-containing protein [Gemmatimonadales bacterium]|nr:DUF4112 domain-containing protein [Gemmatimonadales bacterium]